MKKIIMLLSFSLIGTVLYSQEYTLEDKTVTGIFDAPKQTKSVLFSSINRWISIHYNSAQDVVQLNDKEAGNIIVKGINDAVYKNIRKELYPKKKYIPEYLTIKVNHTLEINIRDEKYRIIYFLIVC